MNKDYTVLTLKHLSGDSLQVLAACLLSILFSIAIPAKYKVTKYNIASYLPYTYKRDYIVTCGINNHSHGLYSMLPRLRLTSCKLHTVR